MKSIANHFERSNVSDVELTVGPEMTKFKNLSVAKVFDAYPERTRERLLFLRELIFSTAKKIPASGRIDEVLKWGQPSYLTPETKSGTTIRIDAISSEPDAYAMYFHCQTTLIETFKKKFGNRFRYEGNRALIFSLDEDVDVKALEECVAAALTYHLKKPIV